VNIPFSADQQVRRVLDELSAHCRDNIADKLELTVRIQMYEVGEKFTVTKDVKAVITMPAQFDISTGKLTVAGLEIIFRKSDSDMYDMLRVLMEDHESRVALWLYDDDDHAGLLSQLNVPANRESGEYFRTTANNINRRVKQVTGVDKFLVATSKSVQVNKAFV